MALCATRAKSQHRAQASPEFWAFPPAPQTRLPPAFLKGLNEFPFSDAPPSPAGTRQSGAPRHGQLYLTGSEKRSPSYLRRPGEPRAKRTIHRSWRHPRPADGRSPSTPRSASVWRSAEPEDRGSPRTPGPREFPCAQSCARPSAGRRCQGAGHADAHGAEWYWLRGFSGGSPASGGPLDFRGRAGVCAERTVSMAPGA